MIANLNETSGGRWRTRPVRLAATLLCLIGTATAAAATDAGDGIAQLTIRDQQVRARLAAAEVELMLDFVDTVGLRASTLGLSVEPVSAGSLRGRLPGAWAANAAVLPLLVRVQPPENGALSAAGGYTVELHLQQVRLEAGLGLRLFRAEAGGAFRDVTVAVGHDGGGTWLRGRAAGASELVVLTETRSAAAVVEAKLDRLEELLAGHPTLVPGSVYGELFSLLGSAEAAWQRGAHREAIERVEDFLAAVSNERGTSIPDTWRSRRDLVDLASEATSAAETLRFSLILAQPQV